ncbi:MAG: hypothetical protein JWN34_855 [Bryobacterales bacterium]|nr:hypothetical protein [Bryobacterales bacterium]
MSLPFKVGFGVAAVILAFVIWRGFVETKGNHLEPKGKIGKIRAEKVDENEMIAIVDFSLQNEADVEMLVRGIEAELTTADGSKVAGSVIAAKDIDNFFRNYPQIGQQFNPPLKARDVLPGHQSTDRMVCLRFDVPEDTWAKRKAVTLRIEDRTGPVTELVGK